MAEISYEQLKDEAESFYLLSKDYCSFIENNVVTKFNVKEYIVKLLNLYLAGINLPEYEDLPIENIDEFRPSLKHDIKAKVKIEDNFWTVFNPFDESSICNSSISDALQDIYADIAAGMECYENGALVDALYYWKLYFDSHWGNHLIEVLKPESVI